MTKFEFNLNSLVSPAGWTFGWTPKNVFHIFRQLDTIHGSFDQPYTDVK